MEYRSVIVETWLWGRILALPAVTSAFGNDIVMDNLTPETGVPLRRLEIVRHPGSNTVRPLVSAGPVVMESFVFDIVGWTDGITTTPIVTAMNAIDASLLGENDLIEGNYYMVVDVVGEIPPADPPRPGEPPAARLGKQYTVAAYARS